MGFATNESFDECGYVSTEALCFRGSCPFLFLLTEDAVARLLLSDKTQRALALLLGMRFPDVRRAARAAGFDDAEIRKGWALLKAISGFELDVPAGAPTADDGALAELDTWENVNYPVISATLFYNFPAQHEVVFKGLVQTTGSELMVTIPKLLERLAALPDDAKAMLALRGVTADELKKPAALVQRVMDAAAVIPPDPADAAAHEKALAEAEKAMWNHYLEWSQILRAKIKRPSHLKRMGFASGVRQPKPKGDDDDAPVVAPDEDDEET